jgi:hypothetical protein
MLAAMRCESGFGGRRGTDMGIIVGVVLTLAVFVYMFWPEKNPFVQADKTRVDYLRERKDTIYENLRDLNFEYLAGKYPEQDYLAQRTALEDEAARVIAEMEMLEARGVFGRGSKAWGSPHGFEGVTVAKRITSDKS